MSTNSTMMSWQDKLESAKKVMEVLDHVEVKDGDKERELLDILVLTAKLLLPCQNVTLSFNSF
jgi:hypothetical protein